MSVKNPLTSPGVEPATFRFVAQHNRNEYQWYFLGVKEAVA